MKYFEVHVTFFYMIKLHVCQESCHFMWPTYRVKLSQDSGSKVLKGRILNSGEVLHMSYFKFLKKCLHADMIKSGTLSKC